MDYKKAIAWAAEGAHYSSDSTLVTRSGCQPITAEEATSLWQQRSDPECHRRLIEGLLPYGEMRAQRAFKSFTDRCGADSNDFLSLFCLVVAEAAGPKAPEHGDKIIEYVLHTFNLRCKDMIADLRDRRRQYRQIGNKNFVYDAPDREKTVGEADLEDLLSATAPAGLTIETARVLSRKEIAQERGVSISTVDREFQVWRSRVEQVIGVAGSPKTKAFDPARLGHFINERLYSGKQVRLVDLRDGFLRTLPAAERGGWSAGAVEAELTRMGYSVVRRGQDSPIVLGLSTWGRANAVEAPLKRFIRQPA